MGCCSLRRWRNRGVAMVESRSILKNIGGRNSRDDSVQPHRVERHSLTMKELLHALVRVYSEPPQQWHPWLIHFPIVFLLLDGLFTVMFWFKPRAAYERRSLSFLGAALVTMVLAVFAGIHDSGLDLGEGNVFLLGLQDRWKMPSCFVAASRFICGFPSLFSV
jgi:Predicted membrane protein (DUF2231)